MHMHTFKFSNRILKGVEWIKSKYDLNIPYTYDAYIIWSFEPTLCSLLLILESTQPWTY